MMSPSFHMMTSQLLICLFYHGVFSAVSYFNSLALPICKLTVPDVFICLYYSLTSIVVMIRYIKNIDISF